MSNIELSKVSVVIPYYKSKDTIMLTIDSLIKAGFMDNQILIVDDNSNDGMLEKIISKNNDIKYIKNKKNSGTAYSRNVGISNSHKEYILFIDSDVYFEQEQLINLLENNSNYDVIFPRVIYDDGFTMTPNNNWEMNYCMCSAIFLIKRDSISRLNELFDVNYSIYGEDSDFFLRCKAFGLKFRYVSTAIFKHPKHLVYSERGYYLRTRNIIYFSFKLGGIIKYKIPIPIYLAGYTLFNFIMALINRHIHFSLFKLQLGGKYSHRYFPQIRLISLFILAILWNIYKIPIILKKRYQLKRYLDVMKA